MGLDHVQFHFFSYTFFWHYKNFWSTTSTSLIASDAVMLSFADNYPAQFSWYIETIYNFLLNPCFQLLFLGFLDAA